jgi:hypothetical protein
MFTKKTVATIVAGITSKVRELEAHAAASCASALHHRAKADEHHAQADNHDAEAALAGRIADNLSRLVEAP